MKRDTKLLEEMYELIGTHENEKAKQCVFLENITQITILCNQQVPKHWEL